MPTAPPRWHPKWPRSDPSMSGQPFGGVRDDDIGWAADALHAPVRPPVALPGAAKSRAKHRRPVPGTRVTPLNAADADAQWCVPLPIH